MKKKTAQFAICLNNEGYEASLEVGKVYRVLPDREAAAHGYIRMVDEFTRSNSHPRLKRR